MEDEVFSSDNSAVRAAQVELLRKGMAEFKDQHALTEEEIALIEAGKMSEISLKAVYWAKRFYNEGLKIHRKEQASLSKTLGRPATIGEMGAFVRELVYGQGGIKEGLDQWVGSVNKYVVVLGEALKMKGILTQADLEAAEASLKKEAEESVEKISEQAKADADDAEAKAKVYSQEPA